MSRARPTTHKKASAQPQTKRAADHEARRTKRRDEVRASWAAGLLAVLLATGSLVYFLNSNGPPFEGRGAALANWLYAQFGPIGPALPWLAISGTLALVSLAASRGWGKDIPSFRDKP